MLSGVGGLHESFQCAELAEGLLHRTVLAAIFLESANQFTGLAMEIYGLFDQCGHVLRVGLFRSGTAVGLCCVTICLGIVTVCLGVAVVVGGSGRFAHRSRFPFSFGFGSWCGWDSGR